MINSLLLQMAIEIVDLPTKKWWFSTAMLVISTKYDMVNLYLVGGAFQPSWKIWVRQEGWHPIYEMENKSHVPNHQPYLFFQMKPILGHSRHGQ